jgi:hypothetical protein
MEIDKNEMNNSRQCGLFVNKIELSPTSAGALPSKLMYREEASSTLIVVLIFEHTRACNLSNDDLQLIVKLIPILNSEGACAPLSTSNESAKLIVVLSDKDSKIFCEGEWLSTTTNTHVGSSGINGLIGQIGLIRLVGISGLVGQISLISLVGISGFGLVSLVSLFGFSGLGLVSLIGLISLIDLIGFVGLKNFVGFNGLVGIRGFGLVSLVGLGGFGLFSITGIAGFVGVVSHNSIIGLINLAALLNHWLIGLIGVIGFGLISLVGLSGFGLIGLRGINGLIM